MYPVIPLELSHLAADSVLWIIATVGAVVSFLLRLR